MTGLLVAAGNGYLDIVERLFCAGAVVDATTDVSSPFPFACLSAVLYVSSVLHVQDRVGALHLACKGGHIAVVRYLLSLPGIDIKAESSVRGLACLADVHECSALLSLCPCLSFCTQAGMTALCKVLGTRRHCCPVRVCTYRLHCRFKLSQPACGWSATPFGARSLTPCDYG